MDTEVDYDEFAMLKQYADHENIAWDGPPVVRRRPFAPSEHPRLSALSWKSEDPEVVLLHGNAQNAHTWDSVAMALDRPALAFDLPGHGYSDWRDDHDYGPWPNARAIAAALTEGGHRAGALVGMSLGGMTSISLTAQFPELVERLVIVDITPGIATRPGTLTNAERGAAALQQGPAVFASFEEMLESVAAVLPGRPIESLRPGVRHNSRQLPDGRWSWRYDPERPAGGASPKDRSVLWDEVSAIRAPIMLVRGSRSAFVHDDDVVELTRRQADVRVEQVEGAGHSVQSDKPVELARLIADFIATT